MITLLICLILASWTAAIAIFSVQNATAVSIQFLFFRSIELPLGIVLAFGMGIGLFSVAILQLFWKLTNLQANSNTFDEDENWE